jgi:hypothetical protein
LPLIFSEEGFRVLFYSNEGSPREPLHVHVRRGEANAKYWIDPAVRLEESYGFSSADLRTIEELILRRTQRIREAWNEHFGS